MTTLENQTSTIFPAAWVPFVCQNTDTCTNARRFLNLYHFLSNTSSVQIYKIKKHTDGDVPMVTFRRFTETLKGHTVHLRSSEATEADNTERIYPFKIGHLTIQIITMVNNSALSSLVTATFNQVWNVLELERKIVGIQQTMY